MRSDSVSRTVSRASNCRCSTTVPPSACTPPMIANPPMWHIGMLISTRSRLPVRIAAFIVRETPWNSRWPMMQHFEAPVVPLVNSRYAMSSGRDAKGRVSDPLASTSS